MGVFSLKGLIFADPTAKVTDFMEDRVKTVHLTDEQVRATVLGDAGAPCWSAGEQALIAAVDALHASATLSEAQFKVLSAHYDDAKIFEIILLCGFYRTVSYLANGLDLPLEATAARFPS